MILTKAKDFTDCNPEIAEALKAGSNVWCDLWDGYNKEPATRTWVVDYKKVNDQYRYITENAGGYPVAEPAENIRYALSFWELLEVLKKQGYQPVFEDFGSINFVSPGMPDFESYMFEECGRLIVQPKKWHESWTRELPS